MPPTIQIKRVYDPPLQSDGYRVLIDRLWPRGLTKAKAAIDEWDKALAPSSELRKWFGHLPVRWAAFQKKYTQELVSNTAVHDFISHNEKRKLITLLYGAKDSKHTHALVLQSYLRELFELKPTGIHV